MPSAKQLDVLEGHFKRSQRIAQLKMAQVELMNVGTGLEIYQVDKGSLPARLDQLVPEYLHRVPTCSGQPYTYAKTGKDGATVSAPGASFGDLGLPSGYPQLVSNSISAGSLTLKLGPKVVVSKKKPAGEKKRGEGLDALSGFETEKGIALYKDALKGGLGPVETTEVRRFLKEWESASK